MIDAAIPVKAGMPGKIEQSRRIARSELVVETVTKVVVKSGKGSKLLVTRCTGEVAVL
jgi:hypothetical protein